MNCDNYYGLYSYRGCFFDFVVNFFVDFLGVSVESVVNQVVGGVGIGGFMV